jgi:mRNA interferase HicA
VKRSSLLRHLRTHGCVLKREGGSHSLWMNPATAAVEAIPRHTEIPNVLTNRSAAILESPNQVQVDSAVQRPRFSRGGSGWHRPPSAASGG